MKVGDVVRHKARPQWGRGVIIEDAYTTFRVRFEHHGEVRLDAARAFALLEPVPPDGDQQPQ